MRHFLLCAALIALAGCVSRPAAAPVSLASTPPAVPPATPAHGWLAVPPRLADGSYATPNRSVSPAGAVWHLRAGLNVAALGCRGFGEAALIAGYNRLLAAHRAEFAAAYRELSREHGDVAAFDTAMTRLYNYYALPPAQPGLCDTARSLLTELSALPAGSLNDAAPSALRRIDAPFVALFAAQDAGGTTRSAARAPVARAVHTVVRAPYIAVDRTVLFQ